MPTAANFTIKDGASTPADTVFTNVQPASGNLPATYFARAKGPNQASQPAIQISSTGKKGARTVLRTIRTPYFVTGTDGVTKVTDSCYSRIETTLPDNVPDDVRAMHQAYLANSCDVDQVRDAEKNGYAPS